MTSETAVALVKKEFADTFRKYLKTSGYADRSRVAKRRPDDLIAVPVNSKFVTEHESTSSELCGIPYLLTFDQLTSSHWMKSSPHDRLLTRLKSLCDESELWQDDLIYDLPKCWEKHCDMVLLPSNSFQHPVWDILGEALWKTVASVFKCSRVAKQKSVCTDGYRTPSVELLLGADGWVEHVDNRIRYSFDATRCMFSSGNISEKLRVANFNCSGETVVDLYAGIGYFTLPYLVHAGASMVYACEWNPAAVEALKRNLQLNRVADRCIVLCGDNRETCPKGVADRVNLGLIPSSESGWPTACAALKPQTGGILHVHGNVTSSPTAPGAVVSADCANGESQQLAVTESGPNERFSLPASATTNCLPPDGGLNCRREVTSEQSVDADDRNKLSAGGGVSSAAKFAKRRQPKAEWKEWAEVVCLKLTSHFEHLYWDSRWSVRVVHVEHVKSYAPHVDHIVADVQCLPVVH